MKLRKLTLISIFTLLLVLLAACGGENTTPNAKDLLSKSQTEMQKVTSYHFNLVAENPGNGGMIGAIKSADGDLVVPDKLKADATLLILGNNVVQTKLIAIGEKQYYTDPFTQKWTTTSDMLDPRALTNSDTGVAALIGHIEDPSTPVADKVDGTECWSIKGKLDAKYLAGITNGGQPAGNKIDVTTCIGKSDNLPYLIRVNGKAVQGDVDKTVRTFKLSKFNEKIEITAPAV
jgi:hypothetical protein